MPLMPAHAATTGTVTVRPGRPLAGTVTVDGSKNAALPLVAAAAALRRPVHLSRVPFSTDVQSLLSLLQQAGWHVARPAAPEHQVVIVPADNPPSAPELAEAARIRASYYLVPALLAMRGVARLPWPGGCCIGDRGMDVHFTVYGAFGDRVTVDDLGYRVETGRPDRGTVSVMLPFRSRGASIAALLRAVVAQRPLRLGMPNLSPEVLSVVEALQVAGWETHASEQLLALVPPSVTGQRPVVWRVPGDKIEAGTLACAVAATGGTARIKGVAAAAVAPVIDALGRLGIPAAAEEQALVVRALDADFEPPLMALALSQPGMHLFADSINPGRHGNLLSQLALLGAEIDEISPTQCRLTGPQHLHGAPVTALDIRTGSALLVAGLTARGHTTVGGVDQLRRGHADLPGKLRHLGADICEAGQ
ncbi:UDP-N-acetylglucosamine 1-carboxyvinyltransferase [Streptomyces violascens]|uniref:UDP-N-acetylglucosamine 1-carboxyvinyltransferase n=1 Tax=Streptomyces violascens TaxID=67381 RepID=UPI0036C2DEBA